MEAENPSQSPSSEFAPKSQPQSGIEMGVLIPLATSAEFREKSTAINEALLIAGLRQHELTAEAVTLNAQLAKEISERKRAEGALQEANGRLAAQAMNLERLVAERTEKLGEAIGELEGFSYSIAHDMRAPLRGMQGFARILLDEYADQLDSQGRGYLERIASSASRMDLLIQDVLNYTRVLRGDALLTSVDLDRLVRDIITTYADWQSPKAQIQIDGTLPVVIGHEGFLTLCISNLLSNAVKFVAPGLTPRVRIWAERLPRSTAEPRPSLASATSEEPMIRVWFENNGIGIAPKDREKVFRMFARINPTEQFEGTGIGMTIARKAVERIGGRIDFESEGLGSRFWIELKKAVSQRPHVSP